VLGLKARTERHNWIEKWATSVRFS